MAEETPLILSFVKKLNFQVLSNYLQGVTKNRAVRRTNLVFNQNQRSNQAVTMVGVEAYDDPTMCNRYLNHEVEYIFACRGRPFGCLLSPHLPTPTSTIIDYNLVKELGLKMFDLQYQKFSYCGNKLRILGRVSFSVQTIHDGLASGSFHIKANVILDLNKTIDCESIAGVKLTSKLQGPPSNCSSSPSSSPPSTPASSKSSSLASTSDQPQPDHQQPPPKPQHRLLYPPPDHRHPNHQEDPHILLPHHQDFLLNLSSIILMKVFLNLSDQKSLYRSQPFHTRIQPSLMPTFMPFPKPSMMPTSYLHPTRKSVHFLKLTLAAEWNQVWTM